MQRNESTPRRNEVQQQNGQEGCTVGVTAERGMLWDTGIPFCWGEFDRWREIGQGDDSGVVWGLARFLGHFRLVRKNVLKNVLLG
jgi:hypothetical protein